MMKRKNDKQMKKVLEQLERDEFKNEYDVFFSELLGVDRYVHVDVGFFIRDIVSNNDALNFETDERNLKAFIKRNNEDLTHFFKKNIVDLYLFINAGESRYISLFHIFFFAHYFPNKIDFNLEGKILLKTNEFSVENMVEKLEDENDKFSFDKFFFMVIRLINEEEVTISNFVKIKEVFGKNISNMIDGLETQKMITPKIILMKSEVEKEPKKIVYKAKKILKVKDANLDDKLIANKQEKDTSYINTNHGNKSSKKDAKKEKNSYRNKQSSIQDINEQNAAYESIQKNGINIQLQNDEVTKNDDEQNKNLENFLKEELKKDKSESEVEVVKKVETESKNNEVEKSENEKENFGVADKKNTVIEKKEFKFALHFKHVIKKIAKDPKSINFILKKNEKICVSLHFLFLKLEKIISFLSFLNLMISLLVCFCLIVLIKQCFKMLLLRLGNAY